MSENIGQGYSFHHCHSGKRNREFYYSENYQDLHQAKGKHRESTLESIKKIYHNGVQLIQKIFKIKEVSSVRENKHKNVFNEIKDSGSMPLIVFQFRQKRKQLKKREEILQKIERLALEQRKGKRESQETPQKTIVRLPELESFILQKVPEPVYEILTYVPPNQHSSCKLNLCFDLPQVEEIKNYIDLQNVQNVGRKKEQSGSERIEVSENKNLEQSFQKPQLGSKQEDAKILQPISNPFLTNTSKKLNLNDIVSNGVKSHYNVVNGHHVGSKPFVFESTHFSQSRIPGFQGSSPAVTLIQNPPAIQPQSLSGQGQVRSYNNIFQASEPKFSKNTSDNVLLNSMLKTHQGPEVSLFGTNQTPKKPAQRKSKKETRIS